MKKKLILLLSMLLVLGSFSTGYAADDSVITEKVITLEQVRGLAYENSRDLKKYEISVDKAKYQQDQAEDNNNDTLNSYNSLATYYSQLSAELSNETDAAKQAEIKAEMQQIETQMESQYDKIKSSSNSIEDSENNYDDSVKEEENYRKQLEFIVEELYTTILNQEDSLLTLNKEYEIKQYLLNVERKKLELGRSSQLAVDKLSIEITNLKKSIIEQTNQIKTKKGQLNDMMGRGYDDEIKLAPFEVSGTVEIPDNKQLLSSATQSYDTLSQLNRDINDLEDDEDDETDYYKSLLLRQDIKTKELQLEDEKIKLNETINNLITDLKSKQADYQLSLTNYRNAQRSYEWDKKRFELGQISKLALTESELNYLNMKDKKESGGYALYLAQRTLKLAEAGIF